MKLLNWAAAMRRNNGMGNLRVRTIDGVLQTSFSMMGFNIVSTTGFKTKAELLANNGNGDFAFVYGAGNTPVEVTNYKLEDELDTLSFISKSFSNATEYDSLTTMVITYTYQNNTTADVSVNEVGLIAKRAAGNDYESCCYLFYREVLPSTVVIHPGELYTFTIAISA